MNGARRFFAWAVLGLTSAAIMAAEAEKAGPVYELRTYYANPGKLEDLHARFRDHTLKLFEKHGMKNAGYWVPVENPDRILIFVLEHPSREAARKSWRDFSADPDWQAAYKESHKDGALVSKAESLFLQPTDYSPPVKVEKADAPQLFELRTYKASPRKLDALNARFRDHTMKLFSKHGMKHFGYWTPLPGQPGAEDTLIYIISHQTPEARDASFNAFRLDKDWIAAKTASEVNGSLTVKVEAVMMRATDYSPAR